MQAISRCIWALAAFFLLSHQLQAGLPTYRILRAPAIDVKHHHHHRYQPGQASYVQPYGYSYGWFGAHARSHKVKHHGWRQNYTQWKYQ